MTAAAQPAARPRIQDLAASAGEVPFVEFNLGLLEGDAQAGKAGPGSITLLETGAVLIAITDPELLSSPEAIRLATPAARLDPRLDAKILAAASAGSTDWPRDFSLPRVVRALELIDAVSDCRRLVIPLMKFIRVPEPAVRSKAVKLMARASRNREWVESVLSDPDPRVRCNLIEGFYAQMGPGAISLLRRAARDPHHRVASTALLFLAQLGDGGSREELHRLAQDSREMQRRAAQWALAKLG